ncbi:hypothetical protein Q3G72_026374 [Acer saccharum]|nr:hypothetical protein Q3G72_026374 [Acer saccharum]
MQKEVVEVNDSMVSGEGLHDTNVIFEFGVAGTKQVEEILVEQLEKIDRVEEGRLNTLCPLCLNKNETTLYALWLCASLRNIRGGSCISDGGDGRVLETASFLDFVLFCKSVVVKSDFECLCVTWWRIWFRRNKVVHSKVIISDQNVLGWAQEYL